jgi:hypothetical protein
VCTKIQFFQVINHSDKNIFINPRWKKVTHENNFFYVIFFPVAIFMRKKRTSSTKSSYWNKKIIISLTIRMQKIQSFFGFQPLDIQPQYFRL